jgi:hypothetical protein
LTGLPKKPGGYPKVVGKKRSVRLVTVGAGAVALCALPPIATAPADDPDLVGPFTPDGTLVAGSDAEGTYSFQLVDPVTLDYCYAEHGQGYRTTCARLQKEVFTCRVLRR